MTLPLDSVRVVDLTVVWAGPSATMFLGDWGADVLKVESIQHFATTSRGHHARATDEYVESTKGWQWRSAYPNDKAGPRPWNRFGLFQNHSRNKKSFTLDLTRPEGLEVLASLIRVSDVFLENNVVETAEKIGVTYEWVRSIRPDIVMVRMPAYGLDGEYKNYRSFGSHVEAVSGHTWLRSYPDLDQSTKDEAFVADSSAGMVAAFAAVSALHRRRRTGEGCLVELSLVENMVANLGEAIMDYTMNGRVQETLGNRDVSRAPQGCYPCQGEDRWIVVSVADDAEWLRLAEVIGTPSLAADPRFLTTIGRFRHHDELDAIISAWTSTHAHTDAMGIIQEARVTAGAVLDDADAYRDPHLLAREFFQEVTQRDIGTYPYPSVMWRSSTTPNGIRQPSVCLGEHNDYVYRDLLGCTPERIAELEANGHIGAEYAPHIP